MSDWKSALANLNLPSPTEDAEVIGSEVTESTTKPSAQKLDIVYERKGRAGKQATIVTGFTGTDEELLELAAILKKKLGTGGSARGGEILIQGDRRQDLLRMLTALGHRARII